MTLDCATELEMGGPSLVYLSPRTNQHLLQTTAKSSREHAAIRGEWEESGFVEIRTCQGRLMLSEIEDVEGKIASSFFNYQIIQLWSKFSEVTGDFNILFYCSAETEIYFFTRVCLSEKPKWRALCCVLSERQFQIVFSKTGFLIVVSS